MHYRLCDVCESELVSSSICSKCKFDNSYQFYDICGGEKEDSINSFITMYFRFSDESLTEALVERFGIMVRVAEVIAEDVYA